MSRTTGTAGFAAALVLAAFGLFHATPSRAWQLDLPAVTPAVITTLPAPAPAAVPAPQDPALDETLPAAPAPQAEPAPEHRTLAQMVADRIGEPSAGADQSCLATAVYFEAKGEPLKGQLGVAHVILNRAKSGRFAHSICGVVKQPGQFSFVHGGRLPHVSGGPQWKTALAVAGVALAGDAPAPAPKALFFHARSVSPGWHGLTRVAAIGNHVFYR